MSLKFDTADFNTTAWLDTLSNKAVTVYIDFSIGGFLPIGTETYRKTANIHRKQVSMVD